MLEPKIDHEARHCHPEHLPQEVLGHRMLNHAHVAHRPSGQDLKLLISQINTLAS